MTIDCMGCLIALARREETHNTYKGLDGVTHAVFAHPSYGRYWALICTFSKRGTVKLVLIPGMAPVPGEKEPEWMDV